MYLQKIINELINKDLKRCNALYERLKKEMSELEEGSLSERNGTYSWCYRINGKQISRKITDLKLVLRLKKRQYIKRALPIIKKRIKNDCNYLENDVIYDPIQIGDSMPEQYRGLKDIGVFLEGDINVEDWLESEYKQGQMFEGNKIYKVDNSTWVRSKSETMISMRLIEKAFHIRYEPEVRVGSRILYPDFAILLPLSRRIVYYEHFGMMDDPEYAMNAMKKLAEYAQNGIILGVNLVISYETRGHPLTLQDIDNVIAQLDKMDREC